jgi:putative endonuclease
MRIRALLSYLSEKLKSIGGALGSTSGPVPEIPFHLKRGKTGEQLAYHCLRKYGYRIVARNYRKYYGEIDLIGWENGVLVFVEVKLRKNSDHGLPQDAVNSAKRRQISRVAKEYRKRHHLHDINYRFDIVSIQGNPGQERTEILKDAFKDPLPAQGG